MVRPMRDEKLSRLLTMCLQISAFSEKFPSYFGSMTGDETTKIDKLTEEKLSVALWLGGGPLFLSAVA
jgi:hypothetical protein